ncbi:MAG: hypothetical protein WC314_07525 [Vulcanimicrobiota bacterium]
MSHSEEREPDSEEQAATEEHTVAAGEPAEDGDQVSKSPAEDLASSEQPELADHRLAALMKMRSQFVTEETLRSTEEHSKPKPKPLPTDPGDDDEFYDEGEYDDDEHYDEEFDDDDYEDEELRPREAAGGTAQVEPPEPEIEHLEEEEDDGEEIDHRVAQLRKLRQTFVNEKDLEIKAGKQAESYKETEVRKVVCPNCQSEELRSQKICAQCGARLPNILVEEEKYNPGSLNKAVLKYYDAVKHLRSEEWSIEQFTDFLHDRYELSKTQIDGLHELIEECGSQEWLPEATRLIFESTEMLETAILIMIDKVNEAVSSHVEFDPDDYPLEDARGNPIEYPFEDEDGNLVEFPLTLEDRILEIDFQSELEEIKKANGKMLETLKMIDAFQKQAQEDLEVSM